MALAQRGARFEMPLGLAIGKHRPAMPIEHDKPE